MNLKQISQHEGLHEKAISRAKTFHCAEADLIDVLQELDSQKTFLHYQCTSLFSYCLKYLKLSEANAYAFIQVARKSRVVPELKEAIRKNEITVSKAKKIAPVLTRENSSSWIELAKTLPKAQLEKQVAKVAPKALTPEKAKYVTDDRVQINLGISESALKRFRRVQDLVSQKTRRVASMEEALEALLENYLQRNDPVEKAKRLKDKLVPGPVKNQAGSRTFDAKTKHQVNLRDQGRCTHVADGKRCENERWLEVHHQVPLSMGGTNSLDNLTTLCGSHHRIRHKNKLRH